MHATTAARAYLGFVAALAGGATGWLLYLAEQAAVALQGAVRACVLVAPRDECGGYLGAARVNGSFVTCDVPAFARGLDVAWGGGCAPPAVGATFATSGALVTAGVGDAVALALTAAFLCLTTLVLLWRLAHVSGGCRCRAAVARTRYGGAPAAAAAIAPAHMTVTGYAPLL
jgi:hypothetical protein